MKFRKKPVEVEAEQFSNKISEMDNKQKIIKLFGAFNNWIFGVDQNGQSHLLIRTLEGDMRVNEGDWIIKGINGEFYPCKPDIFEKTYEKVEENNIAKLVEEVAKNRSQILDDFCKAYLADSKLPIEKLELVEQRTETGCKWYFRIREEIA